MATREEYSKLHNVVIEKMNFRSFFRKLGVVVVEKFTDDWHHATGAVLKDKGRVNLANGNWESDGESGTIYDLIIKVNQYEPGERANLVALKMMCDEVGVDFPGEIPKPISKEEAEKEFELDRFSQIEDPQYLDRRVIVPLTVTGETSVVFDSAAAFEVTHCSMYHKNRCRSCSGKIFELDHGRAEHAASVKSPDWYKEKIYRRVCCPFGKKPVINVLSKITYRQIKASDYAPRRVELEKKQQDRSSERRKEKVVFLKLEPGAVADIEPRGYVAKGWVRTNPKNSERTLMMQSMTPILEDWEKFDLKNEIERLQKVQKMGWDKVIHDITKYKTRIFGYDELALSVMLTYCSVLGFRFNEEDVNGWLKVAVIGGTGVGKSRVFERISEEIGVGDIFSCLTGRRTGLSHATVQGSSGYWESKAGMFPQNSRRILCVEEAQEMPREDIKSIAIAMETGNLRVDNAARGDYESRTRVLFNCNPPKNRTVGSYTYGCQALSDVFDYMFTRRLDLAIFIRRLQENSTYNQKLAPARKAYLSSDDLRALVFFAWNLKPEQIVFTDEATAKILEVAKQLSDVYGHPDDLQLVCPGDIRFTLARIAVAWSVLDLCCDEKFKVVTVKADKIDSAKNLLDNIYSGPNCLLDEYSLMMKRMNAIEDFDATAAQMQRRIEAGVDDYFNKRVPITEILHFLISGTHIYRADLKREGLSREGANGQIDALKTMRLAVEDGKGRISTTPRFPLFWKKFSKMKPDLATLVESYKFEEQSDGQDRVSTGS